MAKRIKQITCKELKEKLTEQSEKYDQEVNLTDYNNTGDIEANFDDNIILMDVREPEEFEI